jgi:hypothetical protein
LAAEASKIQEELNMATKKSSKGKKLQQKSMPKVKTLTHLKKTDN